MCAKYNVFQHLSCTKFEAWTKKQEGEEEGVLSKKTTNSSLLTSHADLELFEWQFVNASQGAEIIIILFHIKRRPMFGKVLSVCLHDLHVILSHIWLFVSIIHKLFIMNIITIDIKLYQSEALFLGKTSFTKTVLLTDN